MITPSEHMAALIGVIETREGLLAAAAEVVRLKLRHASVTAEMEAEVERVRKTYAARLDKLGTRIEGLSAACHDYCRANRASLFPDRKSIDSPSADIGFELTPWRVETVGRKTTWKVVVERLAKLVWGGAYIRWAAPAPDKEALLKDRERLTAEQLTAAGIQFARDEQFFIRPKSDIVEATVNVE